MTVYALKQWVKTSDSSLAEIIHRLARGGVPCIRPVHGAIYTIQKAVKLFISEALRSFYYTPVFQSRLTGPCEKLYLYGDMPLVIDPLEITIGNQCRISGVTTFCGRPRTKNPKLIIGERCAISWQVTIAVGTKVVLERGVHIGGRCFLAGYPGHPMDMYARTAGDACTDDQIGDIILEEGVWLASGVTVLAGVRIGKGSVVAAGSVVTKDIPPGVLAAGIPARVVRPINEQEA